MEWITPAKFGTGEIPLGLHSMGENSGYSLQIWEPQLPETI
jgi:hypothetical protein